MTTTNPPQTCASCACWFIANLPGADESLISGKPGFGACKEGPVTVAKGPRDWCRRWQERDQQGKRP